MFQNCFELFQEARGRCAIHGSVVIGQGEAHGGINGNVPVGHTDPVHHAVNAQNAGLGRIDHRGYEMIFPLYQRLLFGCFALVEYITKSLLPVNLNFFYPFPIVLGEDPPLHYYLYPVVLLFLMGWIIAYRNNRYLVFGVLLFLVNLLFSIHLFNMSRHAIVADRYMYLSYVGIAFLIANGIWWLRKRLSYFKAALVFLFFYCFFLSVYTFHYTKKWENTTMVKKYTKEVLEKRLNGSNHL